MFKNKFHTTKLMSSSKLMYLLCTCYFNCYNPGTWCICVCVKKFIQTMITKLLNSSSILNFKLSYIIFLILDNIWSLFLISHFTKHLSEKICLEAIRYHRTVTQS